MSAGRPAALALAVALLLLLSGTAGFLLYRHLGPGQPLQPAAVPTGRTATSATPAPRPIPEQLPEIALPDLAGVPRRLSDWGGRPLVVNFWATWCEPCRREVPLLEALRHENAAKRLEVVGIAIDHQDSVEKYAKDFQIDYPILVGERGGLEAVTALGVETVLPFTVFADAQGRIVTLKIGELHRDEAAFILARLADLGAGRLSLPAAREQIDDGMRRLAVSRAATGKD